MANDVLIETHLDNLVKYQFPNFYHEEGPVFVAFVQEYFKWMQSSNNALYHSRRLYDYKDVDNTADDFVIYFKEKYLKGLRFNSITPTKTLIKHSLDLYRSKGTERGLDLLFRAVFGVPTEVYYPSADLFRLSDGNWFVPRYLEVSLNHNNASLVNKQISGLNSGAVAFVDEVIRRTVKGTLLDVLYISAINGNFETGEKIVPSDDSLSVQQCPSIIGSLTSIEIPTVGTGEDANVGDIVIITSASGEQAQGRVAEIGTEVGIVDIELIDGGYGYSANADVLISERILTIANVSVSSNVSYYKLFDTLTQPLANIIYTSPTGPFTVGSNVYTYYANNLLDGTGYILEQGVVNTTANQIKVSVVSGNLNYSTFYSAANTYHATKFSYTNRTATGNVIGIAANVIINCVSISGTFSPLEEVRQSNSTGGFITNGLFFSVENQVGGNGTIKLINCSPHFVFQTGYTFTGVDSGASANVSVLTIDVGVYNVNNIYTSDTGNFAYGLANGGNGVITAVSSGSGASFEVGELEYTEDVLLNSDSLNDYLNVDLANVSYGFPANSQANLTTCTLFQLLTVANVTIGRIESLALVNKISDYNKPPIIRIFEPFTYPFYHVGKTTLSINSATGTFITGEEITQVSSNARGLVISSNTTSLYVQKLRLFDDNNFNTSDPILGAGSGVSATVTLVLDDETSEYEGFNAVISNDIQLASGTITNLELIDSGFGFKDNEDVVLDREGSISTAVGRLGTQGHGTGLYKRKGGFLSDQKKLFDGLYWQEYSYDIKSSITLDRYVDMLKQIMHVSGTQYFATLVHKSVVNSHSGVLSASITIDPSPDPFTRELDFTDINNSNYIPIL